MLKVGLIGVGHLGKFHLEQWLEIEGTEMAGVFDLDTERCRQIKELYGVHVFGSVEELLENSDVVDIVTPTINHFDLAEKAIKKSKHVFIEKPMTQNLEEAEQLIALVKESGVKCQIGHIERFNPAILSIADMKVLPRFIEAHRLAQYNPRGTDVSVVLDLMIHDIDIVLALVKSNVKKVSASGVSVISPSYDIANARLEFENQAVANLTASRVSLKNMRKTRLFQKDAYIALDFLNKESEVVSFAKSGQTQDGVIFPIKIDEETVKEISIRNPKSPDTNAIGLELRAFVQAIVQNETPIVSVEDGYAALSIAYQVIEKIENSNF